MSEKITLICEKLRKLTGISIQESQYHIITNRLDHLMKKYSIASIDNLAVSFDAGENKNLENDILKLMLTHETFFFRDISLFEYLEKEILPIYKDKDLKIWCNACSSGQEVYSVGMILQKLGFTNNYHILGTDIGEDVIEKAKSAIYSQFEVQRGLPIDMLLKYATQTREWWMFNDIVKANIEFKTLNIINEIQDDIGMFDIIFCRNLLIYFDIPQKVATLNKMKKYLKDDGYIIFGAAEQFSNLVDWLEQIKGSSFIHKKIPIK